MQGPLAGRRRARRRTSLAPRGVAPRAGTTRDPPRPPAHAGLVRGGGSDRPNYQVAGGSPADPAHHERGLARKTAGTERATVTCAWLAPTGGPRSSATVRRGGARCSEHRAERARDRRLTASGRCHVLRRVVTAVRGPRPGP